MQYKSSKEIRALRLEYAQEINKPNPSYEKLCETYEKIRKIGGMISASVRPDRYLPR